MHLKTNGKARVCKQTAMTSHSQAVVMRQSSKFDTVEIEGFSRCQVGGVAQW